MLIRCVRWFTRKLCHLTHWSFFCLRTKCWRIVDDIWKSIIYLHLTLRIFPMFLIHYVKHDCQLNLNKLTFVSFHGMPMHLLREMVTRLKFFSLINLIDTKPKDSKRHNYIQILDIHFIIFSF